MQVQERNVYSRFGGSRRGVRAMCVAGITGEQVRARKHVTTSLRDLVQDLCSGTYHQGRAEGDRAAHVERYKLQGGPKKKNRGGGG